MQHITDYLNVEDLETLKMDIIDFYGYTKFKGVLISNEICFTREQVESYLDRELFKEEIELLCSQESN